MIPTCRQTGYAGQAGHRHGSESIIDIAQTKLAFGIAAPARHGPILLQGTGMRTTCDQDHHSAKTWDLGGAVSIDGIAHAKFAVEIRTPARDGGILPECAGVMSTGGGSSIIRPAQQGAKAEERDKCEQPSNHDVDSELTNTLEYG